MSDRWVLLTALLFTSYGLTHQVSGSFWISPIGGDWGDATRWDGSIPNGLNDVAGFDAQFPSVNADVRLLTPVTVRSIVSKSIRDLAIVGPGILTIDAPVNETGLIRLEGDGGQLRIDTELGLRIDRTIIDVVHPDSLVDITGQTTGSGSLTLSGLGRIILGGENTEWTGDVVIDGPRLEVIQPFSLGNNARAVLLKEGEVTVNSPTAKPFTLDGGVLVANAKTGPIALHGGAVRIEEDVTLQIGSSSTHGAIHFATDYHQPQIVLPGSDEGRGIQLTGLDRDPNRSQLRDVSSEIVFSAGPQILRLDGGGANFSLTGNLLSTNNVAGVEVLDGVVELAGQNNYTGQTVVAPNATLTVRGLQPLGTSLGTPDDGTIVEPDGRLRLFTTSPSNEYVILNGGRLLGNIGGDVELRADSLISSGTFGGTIFGAAGVTIVADPTTVGTIQLNSPNTYGGQTVIASHSDQQIEVNHVQALGLSEEPAVLVAGNLHLKVQPATSFLVDGGNLRLELPTFDGDVVLRGGALVGHGRVVSITTPVTSVADGSQVTGGLSDGGLVFENSFTAAGDVRVGGRLDDLLGSGNVAFRGEVNIAGDLYIDRPNVEFYRTPEIEGNLVLDEAVPGRGGEVVLHADAELDLVFRGGSLVADAGVTVTSRSPVLTLYSGGIDADLYGVEQIVLTRPGSVVLRNIGNSSADVVVREGILVVEQQLGSTEGKLSVDARRNAAIEISTDFTPTITDPIILNNASGYNRTGGLVLGSRGRGSGSLAAPVDLGSLGSIIGLKANTEFTITGDLRGGDLGVGGVGRLVLPTSGHTYTGRTIVESAEATLALVGQGHLSTTSEVELRDGGILEFDARQVTGETDFLADNIPIRLHGGTMLLVGGAPAESVGPLRVAEGSSEIALEHTASQVFPGVLTIGSIARDLGSTLMFHNRHVHSNLGGKTEADPRVVVGDPPMQTGGILGGWAVVRNRDTYDFATLDMDGTIAAAERIGRPGQLHNVTRSDNVLLTSTSNSLGADTTINSLVVDDGTLGSITVDLANHQLSVVSGGILSSGTSVELANGMLTAEGNNVDAAELIVHAYSNFINISADVVDNDIGPVSIVKSGPGVLELHGSNSYTGTTTINGGRIRVFEQRNIPATADLIINSGSFENADAFNPVQVRNVFLRGGDVVGVDAQTYVVDSGFLDSLAGHGLIRKIGEQKAVISDRGFGGTIEIESGTLEFVDNTVEEFGPVTVYPNGTMALQNTTKISRAITLAGGELYTSRGTLARPVAINSEVHIQSSGTVNVDGDFRYLNFAEGLRLGDETTLRKVGEGVLLMDGTFSIGETTTLHQELGSVEINAKLLDQSGNASILFEGPEDTVLPDEVRLSITSDNRSFRGDVTIRNLTVNVTDDTALGLGTITLLDGGRLIANGTDLRGNIDFAGGELKLDDGFAFLGTYTNNGELNPGASPGTLTIGGDFLQSSSGKLVLEIVSPFLVDTLYTQQNDRLEVNGQMTLDGTLSINLLHEYQPVAGDTFDFLDFTSLNGEFRSVELPRLRDGLVWDLSDLYISGQARIVEIDVAGMDFDGNTTLDVLDLNLLVDAHATGIVDPVFDLTDDGRIDTEDVDQWLTDAATVHGFSESYRRGDANLDGAVNALDLNLLGIHWQDRIAAWNAGDFTADGRIDVADLNQLAINWQSDIGAGIQRASVPECSTGILAWIAVVLMLELVRNSSRLASESYD